MSHSPTLSDADIKRLEEMRFHNKWDNASELRQSGLCFRTCLISKGDTLMPLNSGLVNVVGKSSSCGYLHIYVQDSEGVVAGIRDVSYGSLQDIELENVLFLTMAVVQHDDYEFGVPYKIPVNNLLNIRVVSNVSPLPYILSWDTFQQLKYKHGLCVLKYEGFKVCTPLDRQVIEVYAKTRDDKNIRLCFWEDESGLFDKFSEMLVHGELYLFNGFYIREEQYPKYDLTLNAQQCSIIEPITTVEDPVSPITLDSLLQSHQQNNNVIRLRLMKLTDSYKQDLVNYSLCTDGSLDEEGRFKACVVKTDTNKMMEIPIGCHFHIRVTFTNEDGNLVLTGYGEPIESGEQDSSVGKRRYICL